MSEAPQNNKPSDAEDAKAPRVRGVGNPESHSQDADRHRHQEHQKSDK